MNEPLVTVVCLCYNHASFVVEAIESVLHQTYSKIQLIVVDDASTDNSCEIITKFLLVHPDVVFIHNEHNEGNCKAFNKGFALSKGEYIIDLAADDVLLPSRIEKGVEAFLKAGDTFGVNFTDAEIIDTQGNHIRDFYKRDKLGELIEEPPTGSVFGHLIKKYYICPPTMMVRSKVLHNMGGYDETLSYEDFDFWVRSSRDWKYCYADEILVKKRVVLGSHGSNQYKWRSKQMTSTYQVCKKALQLCDSTKEKSALRRRIAYELKYALALFNFKLSSQYIHLWVLSFAK